MVAYGLYGPAQAKQINYERRQMHTYYKKWSLGPRGSLLPCELKCQAIGQCYRLHQPEVSASTETPRLTPRHLCTSIYMGLSSRRQHSPHPMMGGPLIGWGPPVCTLYHPALNGGKASDWLRPIPCQREGDKLPKGAYQSGNGCSTRVHLPEHLACNPSSRREPVT